MFHLELVVIQLLLFVDGGRPLKSYTIDLLFKSTMKSCFHYKNTCTHYRTFVKYRRGKNSSIFPPSIIMIIRSLAAVAQLSWSIVP